MPSGDVVSGRRDAERAECDRKRLADLRQQGPARGGYASRSSLPALTMSLHDAQFGQKSTIFYDPRGEMIRTLNPDGAEQRVVHGIPTDLSKPDQFTPTPWEAYSYDANDLAPISRTPDGKSLTGAAPATHHFTPSSIVIVSGTHCGCDRAHTRRGGRLGWRPAEDPGAARKAHATFAATCSP